jgi:hypothetical protein
VNPNSALKLCTTKSFILYYALLLSGLRISVNLRWDFAETNMRNTVSQIFERSKFLTLFDWNLMAVKMAKSFEALEFPTFPSWLILDGGEVAEIPVAPLDFSRFFAAGIFGQHAVLATQLW